MVDTISVLFKKVALHPHDARDPSTGMPLGKTPKYKAWQTIKFHENTCGNLGLAPVDGRAFVLDFDPRNLVTGDLDKTLGDLAVEIPGWAEVFDKAPRVRTGSGGLHVYLQKPEDLAIRGLLLPGVDVKKLGGYLVAPPSLHPLTGLPYTWEANEHAPLPMAPQGLLDLLVYAPLEPGAQGMGEPDIWPAHLVRRALFALDPLAFADQQRWSNLLFACHSASGGAEEALQAFVDWSAQDVNYDAVQAAQHATKAWESASRAVDSRRVKITSRYLLKLLNEAGLSDLCTELTSLVALSKPAEPLTPGQAQQRLKAVVESTAGSDLSYEACYQYLDAKYVKLKLGGQVGVVERAEVAKGNIELIAQTAFAQLYSSWKFQPEEGGKAINVAVDWFNKAPSHMRTVFDPSRASGSVAEKSSNASPFQELELNTWQGLSVAPEVVSAEKAEGQLKPYLRLLREGLSAGNRERYDYLTKWLAYCVQYPAELPEVALAVTGDMGTGKTMAFSPLLKLFGEAHASVITNPEHLMGRFNAGLEQKVFLVAEEVRNTGTRKGESMLKTLITDKHVIYEAKGLNARNGYNHLSMVLISNYDDAFPLSLQGERRYALYKASNKFQQNHAFFKEVHDCLYSTVDGIENYGLCVLLGYLQSIDLTGWHPRQLPAELTKGPARYASLSQIQQRFIEMLLDDGPIWQGAGMDEPVVLSKQKLLDTMTNAMKGKNLGAGAHDPLASTRALTEHVRLLLPKDTDLSFRARIRDEFTGQPVQQRCIRLSSRREALQYIQDMLGKGANPDLDNALSESPEDSPEPTDRAIINSVEPLFEKVTERGTTPVRQPAMAGAAACTGPAGRVARGAGAGDEPGIQQQRCDDAPVDANAGVSKDPGDDW